MRRGQKTLFSALMMSLVLVPSVAATPPEAVTGTITLVSSLVTSSRQAGPNTISTAVNTIVIAGDVSGTATFELRQVTHGDGSINTHGVATCACTIDGMSGTVVFNVAGTGSLGPPFTFSGTAVVLSADGDLEGLHGWFTFEQVDVTSTYEGRIHIEG